MMKEKTKEVREEDSTVLLPSVSTNNPSTASVHRNLWAMTLQESVAVSVSQTLLITQFESETYFIVVLTRRWNLLTNVAGSKATSGNTGNWQS